MTDNEKRAHDLALACIPHVMDECNCPYYICDERKVEHVNPDILSTYLVFYSEFLKELNNIPN